MKWCNLNHLTAKVKCRYLYFLTVTVIENVLQLIQTILSIKNSTKRGILTEINFILLYHTTHMEIIIHEDQRDSIFIKAITERSQFRANTRYSRNRRNISNLERRCLWHGRHVVTVFVVDLLGVVDMVIILK